MVDWENAVAGGDPLLDRTRFTLSYAQYLDRHTRAGRRVRDHPGFVAGRWGEGVRHALTGRCWCSGIIEEFVGAGLVATERPRSAWRDALLMGLAEIAALSDERQFARHQVRLLAELVQRGLSLSCPVEQRTQAGDAGRERLWAVRVNQPSILARASSETSRPSR